MTAGAVPTYNIRTLKTENLSLRRTSRQRNLMLSLRCYVSTAPCQSDHVATCLIHFFRAISSTHVFLRAVWPVVVCLLALDSTSCVGQEKGIIRATGLVHDSQGLGVHATVHLVSSDGYEQVVTSGNDGEFKVRPCSSRTVQASD